MTLPLIRTARLVLQPFAANDFDALYDLWTDPDVRRYLWDDQVISRDYACGVLQDCISLAERQNIGHWSLRPTPAGPVIGDVGFRFIPQISDIELMCSLWKQFWSLGLAAEACRALLEYLWRTTEFPRVFARADVPNERSVRLMERLAMRHHSTGPVLITYVLERRSEAGGAAGR
jgi:[ribosomal protein S5]-alanine N-acetyltransferase